MARELFSRADAALGISLTRLCWDGTDAELRLTENAQPAIFTVSVIAARLLESEGVAPRWAAGHSLGELSALAAAGAVSFEDGVRLVRRRGELMAHAGRLHPGTMAVIVGLSVHEVARLCAAVAETGHVELANLNGPEQTVVSGETCAVERLMDLADEEGGAVLPLSVSGAFHSRLMAPIVDAWSEVLATVPFRAPRFPVIGNVTAAPLRTPAEIRAALLQQLTGTVRWTESVHRLASLGAESVVDVGPGRVLRGLTRRIAPELELLDLEALLGGQLTGRVQ